MFEIYVIASLLLMVNILVGLARVLKGPTAADRMLAAEMFATSAVVILLLLATVSGEESLVDVALVFALLSAVTVVTFVSRFWIAGDSGKDRRAGGDS
ncbi:multiple resistance and pH regulation protein F [Thioalkalivibrio denitrificans]|uniref:Multiple resistance and pH regulation protein F n=1 Tax=Thioalkalivibrio denitrificans TaxID=108003 RepID=A0A1V3NC80_9GAMM|nr:monovalent cation/H+ antiporter complex subunit F [Thioalkalivibrio denitrificans]OOG22707.1 multiple resistance and pH regulation protein F [Thioalkalivibrio denitrificans]